MVCWYPKTVGGDCCSRRFRWSGAGTARHFWRKPASKPGCPPMHGGKVLKLNPLQRKSSTKLNLSAPPTKTTTIRRSLGDSPSKANCILHFANKGLQPALGLCTIGTLLCKQRQLFTPPASSGSDCPVFVSQWWGKTRGRSLSEPSRWFAITPSWSLG